MEKEWRQSLLVMKFGGTSVGGARPIERVAELVERYKREGNNLIVVVSALRGVTDSLIKICEYIDDFNDSERDLGLEDIFYKHLEVASRLHLPDPLVQSLDNKIEALFSELQLEALINVPVTPERSDKILSFGERFIVRMMETKLNSRGVLAEAVDGFNLIETNDNFGEAEPDLEKTTKYVGDYLLPMLKDGITPIVTGFIGATRYGKITTLGRGGSDYTASILGQVLHADEVWIWTDVDGIYDVDPRYNPDAEILAELSQYRAHYMARNGAKILYPKTLEPLMGTDIVLRVKNTFNPDSEGSRIIHK